jgi:hypothetical protein
VLRADKVYRMTSPGRGPRVKGPLDGHLKSDESEDMGSLAGIPEPIIPKLSHGEQVLRCIMLKIGPVLLEHYSGLLPELERLLDQDTLDVLLPFKKSKPHHPLPASSRQREEAESRQRPLSEFLARRQRCNKMQQFMNMPGSR